MKFKVKIVSIIIFLLFFILVAGNTIYGADGDESLSITSVDITAPEPGIYSEGQEINVTFTFSQPIKGTLPKYSIYFGNDISKNIELDEVELTDFSTEATYKYTIKSGDNGELKPGNFIEPYNYEIETEDGTKYTLGSPFMSSFENKIYAATTIEWTNFDNAGVEMSLENQEYKSSFKLFIQNVELNENNNYYIHLSHNPNEEIILKSPSDANNTEVWMGNINILNNQLFLYYSDDKVLFDEAGDVYLTVCEVDRETSIPKIVLENYKIEKLPLFELSNRIKAYFLSDSTTIFGNEAYGENNRKVNYKIGRVTDVQLLKAIQNGETTAFENLLDFAKKDNSIATGTLSLGENEGVLDNVELLNDAYYYVYLEMDTEDGKYREIEDVSLYQARVDETSKMLLNIEDDDFEWNLDGNSSNNNQNNNNNVKNDPTVSNMSKLPYAGKNIIIGFATALIIAISIVLYKKYQLYKDIK